MSEGAGAFSQPRFRDLDDDFLAAGSEGIGSLAEERIATMKAFSSKMQLHYFSTLVP